MLRQAAQLQFLLSILGAMYLAFSKDGQHAMSFGLGSVLMTLNWLALQFAWGNVLLKKSIALPLMIIVIKWALFAAICIIVLRQPWAIPGYFAIGIITAVVSIVYISARAFLGERRKSDAFQLD